MSFSALTNALIFTGEAFVENHALLLQNGRVQDLVANNSLPPDTQTTDCRASILAPGFIDLQVNGGANILFNAAPTPEAAHTIAQAHRAYGTTRLLLTCISDTPEVTGQAIQATRQAQAQNPGILGLHLEGPHLGEERRGVHQATQLRDLTPAACAEYQAAHDVLRLITLAPERASPEQIQALSQSGIKIALGHTGADAPTLRAALQAGATGFTHLFNGMGNLSARNPGPAGIALDDRASWCSLIADGAHVADEMIRLAARAKPDGKLMLVSDAMPPAATEGYRLFRLYGAEIHRDGAKCKTADGTLAGSAITLSDAVYHCLEKVRLDPAMTLRMASTNPAMFLGHGKELGKLLPGYKADIVQLTTDFKVKATWQEGRISG